MDALIYIIVNAFLVLLNLSLFFWGKYDESKIRKLYLKDNFWFRTVALPMILKPLQEFSIKQTKAIRRMSVSKNMKTSDYDEFEKKFKSDIHDLMDRCHVINSQSIPLYNDLLGKFDAMERSVTTYSIARGVTHHDIPYQFISIHTETISLLMKFHSKEKFS